jgi:lipoic acid synthetase
MKDLRKPPWLRKKMSEFVSLSKVSSLLTNASLHTVCEEAHCPNRGECFNNGVATFLILGRICTRNCGFCAIESGVPSPPARMEPERVSHAVKQMALGYVVITSVTRDDLADGGASHFAEVIRAIRRLDQEIGVEVLVPDFGGNFSAIAVVLEEGPDVLNHNIETIPRLYPMVRPLADYERSLTLLRMTKEHYPHIRTKSGFMIGLGETERDVFDLLRDLRDAGCDFLTIGQYLQPSSDHLPVVRYVPPEEFDDYKREAEDMGFRMVVSGPFVRSSFQASLMFENDLAGFSSNPRSAFLPTSFNT